MAKTNSRVTVLVPAHNEEKGIADAIESLSNQTLKPSQIIVIADNCTDKTVKIVSKYKDVMAFETIDNETKKAGALNQAFNSLKLEEYVLIMDADTVLDKKAIEEGLKVIQSDNKIGAVCSRAGVIEVDNMNLKEKILWELQHIEYGLFDSDRVEKQGKIKVAHGMCTLFRTIAIESVVEFRKDKFNINSGIFLEDSLVEDYELTLCLKHRWKVMSALKMLAWTDVPLMGRELWGQRERWLTGGVDALRDHSFNKVTTSEILQHFLFIFLMILRVFAVIITVKFLYLHGFQGLNKLVLSIIALSIADSVYRLKYVQDKTITTYVVKFLIIPEMVYNWMQAAVLIRSYYLSFSNNKKEW